MKLISKTIVNYLLICLPLLALGALISYFMIRNELEDGMDENLEREKLNAQMLVEAFKTPANTYLSYDSLSNIKIIDQALSYKDTYADTAIFSAKKHELRNYRILRGSFLYNDTNYLITLMRTKVEDEELISSLFSAFALIIVFLVLSFLIISLLLSKKLWQPFQNTLALLSQYDLKKHRATAFPAEKIKEFNQLNAALNQVTAKIHRDFSVQKEFTENASHEMQTPLSVVRVNLSLLMQSEHLQEQEMGQLQTIENTVKKLSSLNKALILLCKIENNQYADNRPMALKERLSAGLCIYEEAMQVRGIKLYTRFEAEPVVTMSPVLLDVLISNLLQNAVRHNVENGIVHITLQQNSLAVSNTGKPLAMAGDELFTRFKKNDGSHEGLGLGLSIVKSIVQLYDMDIQHNYFSDRHTFIIRF